MIYWLKQYLTRRRWAARHMLATSRPYHTGPHSWLLLSLAQHRIFYDSLRRAKHLQQMGYQL